jgi:hypothetical protein
VLADFDSHTKIVIVREGGRSSTPRSRLLTATVSEYWIP